MSWVSLRPDIENPHLGHVWRNATAVFAVVEFGSGGDLVFSNPEDARGLAAECIKAAEAMERLAAEGQEADDARQDG